jgi:hypothetical protein
VVVSNSGSPNDLNVAKLDRLGRSTRELLNLLHQIDEAGAAPLKGAGVSTVFKENVSGVKADSPAARQAVRPRRDLLGLEGPTRRREAERAEAGDRNRG